MQCSTDDYETTAEDRLSNVKIFVADYFFSIFANFLEENLMDFSFLTSKQINQKGR